MSDLNKSIAADSAAATAPRDTLVQITEPGQAPAAPQGSTDGHPSAPSAPTASSAGDTGAAATVVEPAKPAAQTFSFLLRIRTINSDQQQVCVSMLSALD